MGKDTLLVVYSGRGYQATDGERFTALEDTLLFGEEDSSDNLMKPDKVKLPPVENSSPPWHVGELLQLLSEGPGRRFVDFD
ncbi:MAG: hypothetical protein WKF77_08555 [Planctomycetaceae bacterium]